MRAIIVFLAGAFAALTLAPANGDAAKVVWNYSVWGPPRAFTSGIESTKRIMEEGQADEFELKIHYAGALVPAREYPDSIKIGLIEGGHICRSTIPANCRC